MAGSGLAPIANAINADRNPIASSLFDLCILDITGARESMHAGERRLSPERPAVRWR
jgi:hypothetical protein